MVIELLGEILKFYKKYKNVPFRFTSILSIIFLSYRRKEGIV